MLSDPGGPANLYDVRQFDAQIYTIHIAAPGVDQYAGYRRWV